MPASKADYRNRLILAGGDLTLELVRNGWDKTSPFVLAARDRPELIAGSYDAFLDAGIEIIVTQTAAANALNAPLRNTDVAELDDLNRRFARICRGAVDRHPVRDRSAWGALGPVERLLMLEEITEDELSEAYQRQAEALAEGGVHGIICAHFTELDALRIAAKSAAGASGLPIIAGLSFGSGPDYAETPLGVSIAQACAVLKDLDLFAIAADSGRNPDALPSIIARLLELTDLPVWATCPAGHLQMEDEGLGYSDMPVDFLQRARQIAGGGVTFLEAGDGASLEHVGVLQSLNRAHKPIHRPATGPAGHRSSSGRRP